MIKVGCCGFPVAKKRYFEHFGLVELNRTFYQCPREKTVAGWRANAPQDFEFTVKAHQDISHKAKMRIGEDSLRAFEQMKRICKLLDSKILLIQTPSSVKPDRLADAEKFFSKVDREDLVLVWETRGPAWETSETRDKLGRALKSLNICHVTDPLRILPAYAGEVAYFRLHGLGKRLYYYQFADEELRKLGQTIRSFEKKTREAYVLFNNLVMFDDAMRFTHYVSSGIFPKLTESVGLESVRNVVKKTRYPASKSTLMKKIGWKLIQLDSQTQVKLETILVELPPETFKSADELVQKVKSTSEWLTR